jgi:O-antigen/teichoic acid export membrane protein
MFTINLAGYPLAIRTLEREGVASCHRQIRQNLLLLLAIALPAAAGIAVCATSIASVILGAAFREAAIGLIPWVALGVVIARLKTYYVDLSFHLGRRTVSQIWVMLVAAGVNLGLNLWLIPTLGVQGAIYATIVAYGVALLYGLWVGRRIFPLPAPPLEALKPVAATALTIACLWPFRSAVGLEALLAQIAAGGGIYALALFALDFAGIRLLLLRRLAKALGQPAKPAAKAP